MERKWRKLTSNSSKETRLYTESISSDKDFILQWITSITLHNFVTNPLFTEFDRLFETSFVYIDFAIFFLLNLEASKYFFSNAFRIYISYLCEFFLYGHFKIHFQFGPHQRPQVCWNILVLTVENFPILYKVNSLQALLLLDYFFT